MNAPACFLCQRPTPIERLYAFGTFTIQRCRRCGLEFLDPQPGDADLTALYDERYFSSGNSATRGYDRYEAERANLLKTFRRRWRLLTSRVLPTTRGRLLEVGCALGYFLTVAAETGWEVTGLEISPWAAAEARRRIGVDVREGTLETRPFPPATFDLITMWDVLEHLPDPGDALRRSAELLKPGGFLAVTTPDAGGLLRRLTGRRWVEYNKIPEHLYFFNRSTIQALLERHGFRPRLVRSEGKYVGLDFLLKRLGEANPLLAPLGIVARLPGLRHLSLYVNATNTMLAVGRRA